MKDIIILAVILLIVGIALLYIRREKKKGTRCVGCPSGGNCSQRQSGGCDGSCGH